MKKFTLILSVFGSLLAGSVLSSCGCCTAESSVPALRPEPVFEPLGTTDSAAEAGNIQSVK